MERGCLGMVGIVVALGSAYFVAYAAVELAGGGDGKTTPGTLAGLFVFFLGTMLFGAWLAWMMLRPRPASAGATAGPSAGPSAGPTSGPTPTPPHRPASDDEHERRVLQFAETEHGRVTLAEVAAHCEMSVADARQTLDRLVTQQVADLQVTESGVLVYVFPGFLSDDEKARAEDF